MNKAINLITSLLLLICINLWINLLSVNNNLEVYFLDIGQGDSLLIKTPKNNFIIIDGGKDKSVLNELDQVFPYWADSIDIVIATHPDLDHIGGIYEISKKYKVDTYFINRVAKDSETFNHLRINADNETNYQVNYLNDFKVDGIDFDIIWPMDLTTLSKFEDINDSSISIKISYKNFTLLTMGDLGHNFEIEALSNCDCTNIDILKVSHHGSKTSTPHQLLDITNPKVSIVTVGLNNSYGHPHKEVIDRIRESNSQVYRTDLDGRIKLETDGNKIKVTSRNSNSFIENGTLSK